jgi:hypothetical protein
MTAKRGFTLTIVRATLPPSLAWATEEYRASWLMRELGASSEGNASVFDAEAALFGKGEKLEGMADRFWGMAYYRLRGPDAGRMAKAAKAAGFEVMDALPACESIEAVVELPSFFAREAEIALKAWLAEERVGFIESKAGSSGEAGSRRLSPSERDLKKRILFEAELAIRDPEAGGPFEAKLRLGPKAKLTSWLSRMGYAARRSVSLRILGYGE